MSKKTSHMRSLLDVIKSDEEQNTNQQEREPQNKKTVAKSAAKTLTAGPYAQHRYFH